MMAMTRINYKSDFDFILKLVSCVKGDDGTVTKTAVGWPDHDWTATFWTSSKANTYVASRHGDVLTNCFNDNGQIHIVCNAHKLGVGALKCEFHAELPDAIYPDGARDLYEPQTIDIELVTGQGDYPTEMGAELGLATMYRSAYDDAVQSGYQGTQEEYFTLLSQLPDSVEVAQSLRQSVQDISAMVSDTAAGKATLVNAINSRGYDLSNDTSYNDMADTIKNMAWGEGILAKIGYEGEEDYPILLDEINKSYRAKVAYESGEADSLYNCGMFAPKVEIRDGIADNLFYDTSNKAGNKTLQFVPLYDTPIVSASYMFYGCSSLTTIPQLDTRWVTNMAYMFYGCSKLQIVTLLDLSSITDQTLMFYSCSKLHTLNITNLGKSSLTSYTYFNTLSSWGSTEVGRQSLIDSLITNSYDRAANGMTACKITLHANTKALLTEEELAAITAKGFTIA